MTASETDMIMENYRMSTNCIKFDNSRLKTTAQETFEKREVLFHHMMEKDQRKLNLKLIFPKQMHRNA